MDRLGDRLPCETIGRKRQGGRCTTRPELLDSRYTLITTETIRLSSYRTTYKLGKPNSVGTPRVPLKIVDAKTGDELPAGQVSNDRTRDQAPPSRPLTIFLYFTISASRPNHRWARSA